MTITLIIASVELVTTIKWVSLITSEKTVLFLTKAKYVEEIEGD